VFCVEWTPLEVGIHLINGSYNGQILKDLTPPIKIKCFDANQVQVYNIHDGCINKPNLFCVDASQAGEGSLEIGISCKGHFIPNKVKSLGNSKFEVNFQPKESVHHFANICFNSEIVKGIFV
jgi:filamin